jgi:hypothetical protein
MNQPIKMQRGYLYGVGDDGAPFVMPRQPQTEGFAYQGMHAIPPPVGYPSSLGQHPTDVGSKLRDDPAFAQFNKIPAWYVVTIDLPGTAGAPVANTTPLRPEPFILERITWATTGDTPAFVTGSPGGSAQGRSVTVLFDDEFTKFLGKNPCLVSALFGDSNGYLDLARGMLFQGKQSLGVTLQRLLWPDPDTTPGTTRWDICFQGVSLLPMGINQSGAAG